MVWVQHSDEEIVRGSDGWRIVAELMPGDAEPLVEKNYGDAFEETNLETVLSDLGVGRLVGAGAHGGHRLHRGRRLPQRFVAGGPRAR